MRGCCDDAIEHQNFVAAYEREFLNAHFLRDTARRKSLPVKETVSTVLYCSVQFSTVPTVRCGSRLLISTIRCNVYCIVGYNPTLVTILLTSL